MADYYPLIARAVAKLPENTAAARRELYDRARNALVKQLRGQTPTLSKSQVSQEQESLEQAIRKVETEAGAATRKAGLWTRLFGQGAAKSQAAPAPAAATSSAAGSPEDDGKIERANEKIVFIGFTDRTIPGSIRKYFFRFVDCSRPERSTIEKNLKARGAELLGVSGHDELTLIFPDSQKISDACGAYLKSVAVEIERSSEHSLEDFARTLLAYRKAKVEPPAPSLSKPSKPAALPDVTENVISANLFELLGDRPIAKNVATMFMFTKSSVGGKIELIDLYFENKIVLWNVRIVDDDTVFIPDAYKSFPIRTVGVANRERHVESPPMRAEFES